MVRTSTAKKNTYKCPLCKNELCKDSKNRGFVKHKINSNCKYEKGEKDANPISGSSNKLVEIGGYSERGIMNALFYDIAFSKKDLKILVELLKLINPFYIDSKLIEFEFSHTIGAKILIEQSLSEFGDPDIILLLNGTNSIKSEWKQVIFIEAKVKTSQGKKWEIIKEFNAICIDNKINSSNLFTQLHRKNIFTNAIKGENIDINCFNVKHEENSELITRKLGKNEIVINAAMMIKEYLCWNLDPIFIAIIPENEKNMISFKNDITAFNDRMRCILNGAGITKNWGYLTWESIKQFSLDNKLSHSLDVFQVNKNQIY
jgi:hypothetical protein